LIEQDAFYFLKNNVTCQLRRTPENMYQAIPTFHIASVEKLGGRWEQGQQAHISPLQALFDTTSVHMQSKRVCTGTFLEPRSQLHISAAVNVGCSIRQFLNHEYG